MAKMTEAEHELNSTYAVIVATIIINSLAHCASRDEQIKLIAVELMNQKFPGAGLSAKALWPG